MVRELCMTFQVPYIYDYIKNLRRRQAEVIQNHENANVHDIEKGEASYKNIILKLGGGQAYDRSSE
jgi:hypothetical protein